MACGAGPLAKKTATPELFPRARAKASAWPLSQVAASFFFLSSFFSFYLFLLNK
jgi:hypothetical protein